MRCAADRKISAKKCAKMGVIFSYEKKILNLKLWRRQRGRVRVVKREAGKKESRERGRKKSGKEERGSGEWREEGKLLTSVSSSPSIRTLTSPDLSTISCMLFPFLPMTLGTSSMGTW